MGRLTHFNPYLFDGMIPYIYTQYIYNISSFKGLNRVLTRVINHLKKRGILGWFCKTKSHQRTPLWGILRIFNFLSDAAMSIDFIVLSKYVNEYFFTFLVMSIIKHLYFDELLVFVAPTFRYVTLCLETLHLETIKQAVAFIQGSSLRSRLKQNKPNMSHF